MEENLFKTRDRLADRVKQIQLSGIETSEGWEILKFLKQVEYTIRLISTTTFIGVKNE